MRILVIGAGHNGLIAATVLARKGLEVTLLEEKLEVGGAVKTEYLFKNAPRLGSSSGSYLLGLMPPEIIQMMGVNLPTIRRDPHYFLPCLDGRYLLFGSDKVKMKEQFIQFFSEADWNANEAMAKEITDLRDDLAPSWLVEPLPMESTAERYIRPHLRRIFMNLVTQPVENYLQRFGFKSELLIAMYAVTDGFSGLTGSFGTPGTGMNFLVHNMCRLPGSDGTFMMVKGGMGTIAGEFARCAKEAGAKILTGTGVEKILTQGNRTTGVLLHNGQELKADVVLCNADPFRLREMVGSDVLPHDFNVRLDGMKRYGTTLKINFAMDRLPVFKCLPENKGQHNATIHLLPSDSNRYPRLLENIRDGFDEVQQGRLPKFPTIEWYIHTQADPTLQDAQSHHNGAFFVQWVPYELQGTTWEKEEENYVKHLFSIAEQFAPGFSSSIIDYVTFTPKKIEEHFGIRYGHIHHIDNTFGFDKRMPYATPIEGLYSCSAGCHPAGSVIGAAGYNSARRILNDLNILT